MTSPREVTAGGAVLAAYKQDTRCQVQQPAWLAPGLLRGMILSSQFSNARRH